MVVVLDTNVLLASLAKSSRYRPIFEHLITGSFTLAISNEILLEYIEIIGRKTNKEIAENVGQLLLKLTNVKKVDVRIKWGLIEEDPDDNTFVDCAITANVKFVVTNDKHFKVLKDIDFPYVEVISATEFLAELDKL